MRTLGQALMASCVALTILVGSHAYIWARLVRQMHLSPRLEGALTALLALLALSIPLAMVWGRRQDHTVWRPLLACAYAWLGLMFITVCLLAGVDVVTGVLALWRRLSPEATPVDPARRLVIARTVGGATQAAALAAGALAVATARLGLETRRVPLRVPGWPASLAGLTIAQISDLHIAPLLGSAYVAKVVAECNRLAPDVVVITGDLVDGRVPDLWAQAELLGQLRARRGVYFVTGNHEYYSGVEPWLAALARLDIRVLRNERVAIDGADGRGFDLVGIDDLAGRGMAVGHGPDLARALAGRAPGRPAVLLAHQPRMVDEAARFGVEVMLSGHTHGGQIWPFGALVRLVQPYVAGWAQHGPTQIYVNRGTGYWGPPMRLGQRPELTLFSLSAAA